jgi:hypothetical protein
MREEPAFPIGHCLGAEPIVEPGIKFHTGNKYVRKIKDCTTGTAYVEVDVYSVLEAFNITCPGRQHAIKKLLCAGLRSKGSAANDLKEAIDAIRRAIIIEEAKQPKEANQ